jgi:succinyl-diaminopimelate desuccinylase
MELLGGLGLADGSAREFIEFYNTHIGYDLGGERLGLAFEDGPSGKTVLNVGLLKMDAGSIRLTLNVRYPVTKTDVQLYESMLPLTESAGVELEKTGHKGPIYFPEDDPLVVALAGVYKEYTGDGESVPLVIGGGTYARAIPGAVAFGPRFPWSPAIEHQADENKAIDELVLAAKIYADAIYRLAKQ